ncbi:hypothetical protein OEA41_010449 [Lepraria neglecta]|uniref:Serine-threonine kinase receptor-associated protein n=1 Tax=Lepraria neglecta TaxID=209136 RepID=A0AAE0DDU5_9LECA|nr:hypothetical protein OEA41_010449 [Lepraria neglecta]
MRDRIGTFIGHKGACWQARLSSDATLAATASADFSAKVWDTHTGECLHTLQHAHIVRAVAFPSQPRPQILATGGFEKKLMIYDLSLSGSSPHSDSSSPTSPTFRNGNTNISHPPGFEIGAGTHKSTIKSIIWGNNPNVLITACEDKQIRWFDIRTRDSIASYTLDGPIGSCELNPSMSTLSVAAGKTAYFFSGTTPAQLLKSITLAKEVASVAVHEGERKFVTGGNQDTWVKVWDLDGDGGAREPLDVWKGHHGPIWSLGFSPDGKICASGSEDGTVKLWKFCEGGYGLWGSR